MNPESWGALQADCERVYTGIKDPGAFSALEGSSILLTGGTGFLGSWVCQFLAYLKTNRKISFNLFVVARDKQRFLERLGPLRALNPQLIRTDIGQLTEIPKEVNYIIHAAGTPDSRYHMSNPLETMAGIGEGTMAVLRAAERLSDLRMLVHLSSGSVYGSQPESVEAINEEHPLVGPALDSVRSVYTEAKRYSEVLCASARSQSRLPIVVLRPFTFLGPFQSLEAPWAINNFIQDGLMGRPIRVLGNGKTVRGFLYGADAAGWIVKILLGAKAEQIYNIGSAAGHPLLEIAEKVAANFDPRPNIILNSSLVPSASPSRYLAGIGKLSTDLNLRQYTNLDLAIRRTIEWYRALNPSNKAV